MSQVLLVTGGGRGIGAATAQLAAERGYVVCVNYRSNHAAAAVVAAITAAGGSALAVQADVSSEADVTQLFETCDARLGPLTALVTTPASSSARRASSRSMRRACSGYSRRTSPARSSARARR